MSQSCAKAGKVATYNAALPHGSPRSISSLIMVWKKQQKMHEVLGSQATYMVGAEKPPGSFLAPDQALQKEYGLKQTA